MRFLMILTIVLMSTSCVTWVSKSTEQGSVTGLMSPGQAAELETADAQADTKRQQARVTEIAVRKGQSISVDENKNGSRVVAGTAAEYEAMGGQWGAYGFPGGNVYGNPGIDRARAQAMLDNPYYGPPMPQAVPPSVTSMENDPLTATELARQRAELEKLKKRQNADEQDIDNLYDRVQ